jgi:NodT family efflux transporter outer membrane factor (OMF) lipoprotein
MNSISRFLYSARLRSAALITTGPLILFVTTGCVVGPDYHAPTQAIKMNQWGPAQNEVNATTTGSPAAFALGPWWTTFNDPQLTHLIERALASSPDIAIAEQRVREARAGLRSVTGGRYPQIGAGAGAMEYRRTGPLNTIYRESYSTFQTGFDASWEIDLWGGTRRAVESAGAAWEATQEESHGVRVSLAAEVARTYVELRAGQRRLAIAHTNLALQQRTLDLTRERLRAGVASDLDEARASGLVANTLALLPQLEDGNARLVRLLGILLGEEPNALAGEFADTQPMPTPPAEVAAGLPAELLRHRPDIRAAERRLAAATARIGVAEAQLYPKLGLAGTLGFVSTRNEDLFDYSNRYFGVGPGLHWNLFNGGRVRAQVEAESARTDRALAEYHKIVLAALADVENSLGSFHAEQRRHRALNEAADSARRAVTTATELYRQGVTDFLSVIDAERSLASAEDNLAQSDRAICINLIALYKSLGGGWQIDPTVAVAKATRL